MNEPLTPTERAARERLLRIGNAWATRPLYVDGDALNQDCLLVVNALDRLMSPAATPTEEVVPSDPVPDTHVAALLANVNDIIESTRKYHVADRPNGYCEVCGIRMPCDKLLDAATFEELAAALRESEAQVKRLDDIAMELQELCDSQAKKLAASEAECERLQRELDVADVLAHEEIARLQTALAKSRERPGKFEALAVAAKELLQCSSCAQWEPPGRDCRSCRLGGHWWSDNPGPRPSSPPERHRKAAGAQTIAQLTERLATFEALAVDAKALTDISDPDAADIVATIGIADALAALASPSAKEGA